MDTKKIDTLPPDGVVQKRIFLQFLNDVQAECKNEITETKPFGDGTHFVCHFNRDSLKKPDNEETWINDKQE